jgi:hypothetical protein
MSLSHPLQVRIALCLGAALHLVPSSLAQVPPSQVLSDGRSVVVIWWNPKCRAYTIESSTDLQSWRPAIVATNLEASDPRLLIEIDAIRFFPTRFYRLRSLDAQPLSNQTSRSRRRKEALTLTVQRCEGLRESQRLLTSAATTPTKIYED